MYCDWTVQEHFQKYENEGDRLLLEGHSLGGACGMIFIPLRLDPLHKTLSYAAKCRPAKFKHNLRQPNIFTCVSSDRIL